LKVIHVPFILFIYLFLKEKGRCRTCEKRKIQRCGYPS